MEIKTKEKKIHRLASPLLRPPLPSAKTNIFHHLIYAKYEPLSVRADAHNTFFFFFQILFHRNAKARVLAHTQYMMNGKRIQDSMFALNVLTGDNNNNNNHGTLCT